MILYTTDKEFLASIGVVPYDPDLFRDSEKEKVRTWVIRGVAALQFVGLIAALVWTWQ